MTKLRQLMIQEMQLRNLAERTQESYLHAVKKLTQYYHRSPDTLTEKEVHDYLRYEMNERKLSCSSINQKMNAFLFFYRETLKRPKLAFTFPKRKSEQRLPEVLSPREIERLFRCTTSFPSRIAMKAAYGSGLRLNEVLSLKVTDIDSQRMMIRVEQGKGNKDRYTILPESLLEELRFYWRVMRPKTWLFPGKRGKERLHETAVQRAFRKAAEKAGITKNVSFHSLRHSFATHLLEKGENIVRIQILLGHRYLETTRRYTQITQRGEGSLPSPLDLLKNV